ncbi:hypothetical protein GG344DRAFT_74697 [Lentinula edodes]|nr:hypothetical protein GG344DRAFT_74697 [Lentinula edodes]
MSSSSISSVSLTSAILQFLLPLPPIATMTELMTMTVSQHPLPLPLQTVLPDILVPEGVMLPISRPIHVFLLLAILLVGVIAFPLAARTGRPMMLRISFFLVRCRYHERTRDWSIVQTEGGQYASFEVDQWLVEPNEHWYLSIEGHGLTTNHEAHQDQWVSVERKFQSTNGIFLYGVTVENTKKEALIGDYLRIARSVDANKSPVLYIYDLANAFGDHFHSKRMFNLYWPYMERMITKKGNGALGVLDNQDQDSIPSAEGWAENFTQFVTSGVVIDLGLCTAKASVAAYRMRGRMYEKVLFAAGGPD